MKAIANSMTATSMVRDDYGLADNLVAESGQVFLTGTQALVRLLLMQRQLDARVGLTTGGFVSGYRGSPLGQVDQQLWKNSDLLKANGIDFLPAINEDLAAAACLGTQLVESDPLRTVDGVFAMWYGKGPGVDRSGDAFRHGAITGSSPQGGVLVVAGDDHGCVSSAMSSQSDIVFEGWGLPVVHPANVAEYLEFGLYGWALSRFSGTWVAFKAISEVVESGMTVNLDAVQCVFDKPADFAPPPGGLHARPTDRPSPLLEDRLSEKLAAVRAFARVNSIDRHVAVNQKADVGIVTVGKAHFDFMEALRRLDLSLEQVAAAGVRVYKVGLVWPLEPTRIFEFAQGLTDILVVEEKAPVVERQIKELLYSLPAPMRPRISGKTKADGGQLLAATGELRPSRVMPSLADWLARLKPVLDRCCRVVEFIQPRLLANAGDAVQRTPYFCAGCPHNTSTRVPEGSRAQAGIGCHGMALWMERRTTGFIQMGAEGTDWVGRSRFTREKHVFQNLGDGTYYHSGYLAIRQAIAAGANMTFKVLYNDAVAMTGGQPIEGSLSVARIARQVEAEGARSVVVVSDVPGTHRRNRAQFPRGVRFHHRSELDAVQRRLREVPGVSVLIYEQTCAAEQRRRRKRNEYPNPPRRIFINQEVCEGCGDCGVQSNCMAIMPVDSAWGRKRRIDQTACNKDFSCLNGFCPSFVTVHEAVVRTSAGTLLGKGQLAGLVEGIPAPPVWNWSGPFDLLIAGVGGTGVVTLGALVTMAAHLEGKQASVLDFMGFAQKGGAVLSFVRIAQSANLLNQVRIDSQQADCLLACDLVVGASGDALQTVSSGRTKIIANTHELPTAAFVKDADANIHASALIEKMRFAAGQENLLALDAQEVALRLLGDTMAANILMLGYCWQRGLLPVSKAAIERAIELNGVAVEQNKLAFALGRLACADAKALFRLMGGAEPAPPRSDGDDLDGLLERCTQRLTEYQDAGYASRYACLVAEVRARETSLAGAGPLTLTATVARQFAKLMAYKDEYEVARLFTAPAFAAQLSAQFSSWGSLSFHMAPPFLPSSRDGTPPRKRRFGAWLWPAMRLLAKGKVLRGTVWDVFGKSAERRSERQIIADYESKLRDLLPSLTMENLPVAIEIAAVPGKIRGFGHIKTGSIAAAKAQWSRLDGPVASSERVRA